MDSTEVKLGRLFPPIDFWSNPQEEVAIPAIAATLALPSVTVDALPAGAVVVRAVAMLTYNSRENINIAAENSLDGTTVAATSQVIQVRSDAPGIWTDGINFVDEQLKLAANSIGNGNKCIGSVNLSSIVIGNDTYEFRYLLAKAHLLGINLNDVQVCLKIWYSV
jgi:hypothetical protein